MTLPYDPLCTFSRLVAQTQPASAAVIQAVVAHVFSVDVDALRRTTRGRAGVALARQVAMYLAHAGCGLNKSDAGTLFARDRTTVAHACGLIEDRRDDPIFDHMMQLIEGILAAQLHRSIAPEASQ